MGKGYLFRGLLWPAMALLILSGLAVAADQVSVKPGQLSENQALEEQGLELQPLIDNSGNNGSVPTIDSIPPDGVLLIPESTTDMVGMYDPYDGTYLGNLINGGGMLSTPINAVQGSDGNVYVSDQIGDGVFVYDTTGAYLYTYCDGTDGLDNVRGIDFRNDTLYVTCGADYVAVFDGPHNRLPDFINGGINPFDILFLEDGRALVSCLTAPAGVRLYDVNGSLISTVISVSFPEQTQVDDLEPGVFLNGAFSSNIITDFDLDGTIYQTTPLTYPRGVFRLGNGNILATNSSGVFELDPGTGNILQQENTGSARFIELYKPEVTGEPGTLLGTVTDLQMNPIEDAIVAIGYRRDTTDASGNYSFDLYPNTYTATASAQYHIPVTIEDILIVENETTTVDFALPTPEITVDTSPIQLQVEPGQTVTVQRNVANTGDGELEFNVAMNIGPGIFSAHRPQMGIKSMSERILRSREQLMDTRNEYSPTYTIGQLPTILDFGDEVFMFDPEGPTGDIRCLGVEFDGTYFWVTGAGDGSGSQNRIHKFDSEGNYITSYMQNTSSAWGWRDLAWDGEYLYASDDTQIDIFDPVSGQVVGSFSGPENPNRALAYDPDTDHFWTANFSSNIYEFDRAGNVINTFPNPQSLSIYGMAWDDASDDGPWLWIFSQDGSPMLQFSQFDPEGGTFTGIVFYGIDNGSGGIAGGAAFSTEWDPTLGVIFGLHQGTPDIVKGYEITPYSQWLSVDPMSGILQPTESVDLDITIDFTGDDIVPDSVYEATISVQNNTPVTPEIEVEVSSATGIEDGSGLPRVYALAQNFPNPFNAQTSINFSLPQQSDVKIEVYNILGQKTATLAEGLLPAGNHTVTWDASDVASGVYYYKLSAGDYSAIKMMTLLK